MRGFYEMQIGNFNPKSVLLVKNVENPNLKSYFHSLHPSEVERQRTAKQALHELYQERAVRPNKHLKCHQPG